MSVQNESTAQQPAPLYEGELPLKNPFGAVEGQQVYHILIDYQAAGAPRYLAAYVVPVMLADYHDNELEGAATVAFLWAKDYDGLPAGLMAYCSFYYRHTDADAWAYIDF